MTIDLLRTMHTHPEHRCTLKQAEKKRVRWRRMHELVQGKLIEHQMSMQSRFRGSLQCAFTTNQACKQFPRRDLNAMINICRFLEVRARPADLCRVNV